MDRLEAEFQLYRVAGGRFVLRYRDFKGAIKEQEAALTRRQGEKVRDVLFPAILDVSQGKLARPS